MLFKRELGVSEHSDLANVKKFDRNSFIANPVILYSGFVFSVV